jgi:hypothetical protein
MWLYANRYGTRIQNCLVAARFASKSFLTILAKLMKMASVPNTKVSWVPGGNKIQIKQPRKYLNILIRNSSVLSRMKSVPWQQEERNLSNGSSIQFYAPTEEGVHSARGTDIVFDEAQDLDQEVLAEALPQLGVSNAQISFLGMSECDTIMDRAFHDTDTFSMLVPIQEVTSAGIVTEVYVNHVMASDLLTQDQIDVMYHCKWIRKSDRVFAPVFVDEMPEIVGGTERWGWDLNPVSHHWGIKAASTVDGNVVFMKEAMAETYAGLLDLLDCPAHVESNSGYDAALADDNEMLALGKIIIPDRWDAKTKPDQVATMIRLQEHGQWIVYRPGCPIFTRNVTIIPFNDKGVPDKDRATKLKINAHVVDGGIHAGAAVAGMGRFEIDSATPQINVFGQY